MEQTQLTALNIIAKDLTLFKEHKKHQEVLKLFIGFNKTALNLEQISKQIQPNLTRERVRQILQAAKKRITSTNSNCLKAIHQKINTLIGVGSFIHISAIIEQPFFSDYTNNIRGLCSILSLSDIKHLTYRKEIYFYRENSNKTHVIDNIRQQNKTLRKNETKQTSTKTKTATFITQETKNKLLTHAKKHNLKLNTIYEQIVKDKILFSEIDTTQISPIKQIINSGGIQLGIYIEHDTLLKIKEKAKSLSNLNNKNISTMGLISHSIDTWFTT